jgi:hypothetical protein
MACPLAPASLLGVRHYSSIAPLLYVASEGNEISLYDLQHFKTRVKISAWHPRLSQTADDGSPVSNEITDMNQAQLPGQVRDGLRTIIPMPSGGLLCAGAGHRPTREHGCVRCTHVRKN